MLLIKESHLAEKISWVEIGENNLFAITIVFNHHCDRTLDNVVESIPLITGVDNGAFSRVATSVAVG